MAQKLRTVIQLEDNAAQVRKEYEMLRIEFEKNLAANEQIGPLNKDMRNLIPRCKPYIRPIEERSCKVQKES